MSRTWSVKDTFELIERYKANRFLWDSTDLQYKDKEIKREAINNIALVMNTSPEEIVRKLHNLKCQLRQQIRKTRNKKRSGNKMPTSSWCYFSAMQFLIPIINKTYTIKKLMKEGNLEERNTEEYRSLEKMEERYEQIPVKCLSTYNEESTHSLRFLSKIPDKEGSAIKYMEFDEIEERREKNTAKYANISYDEEPRHSLRIVPKTLDDDDRFGEYVALELRNLRSEVNKRRLKSEIRKAICRIADFDDVNVLIPSAPPDPLSQYSSSSSKYSQICEITNVKSENA